MLQCTYYIRQILCNEMKSIIHLYALRQKHTMWCIMKWVDALKKILLSALRRRQLVTAVLKSLLTSTGYEYFNVFGWIRVQLFGLGLPKWNQNKRRFVFLENQTWYPLEAGCKLSARPYNRKLTLWKLRERERERERERKRLLSQVLNLITVNEHMRLLDSSIKSLSFIPQVKKY